MSKHWQAALDAIPDSRLTHDEADGCIVNFRDFVGGARERPNDGGWVVAVHDMTDGDMDTAPSLSSVIPDRNGVGAELLSLASQLMKRRQENVTTDDNSTHLELRDVESVDWQFPWWALEVEERSAFEAELAREVCPTHVLAGVRVTAVAQGGYDNSDNIIYFVHTEPPQIAAVHLTYCRTRETDPAWPSTGMYSTIEDLLADIYEQ